MRFYSVRYSVRLRTPGKRIRLCREVYPCAVLPFGMRDIATSYATTRRTIIIIVRLCVSVHLSTTNIAENVIFANTTFSGRELHFTLIFFGSWVNGDLCAIFRNTINLTAQRLSQRRNKRTKLYSPLGSLSKFRKNSTNG